MLRVGRDRARPSSLPGRTSCSVPRSPQSHQVEPRREPRPDLGGSRPRKGRTKLSHSRAPDRSGNRRGRRGDRLRKLRSELTAAGRRCCPSPRKSAHRARRTEHRRARHVKARGRSRRCPRPGDHPFARAVPRAGDTSALASLGKTPIAVPAVVAVSVGGSRELATLAPGGIWLPGDGGPTVRRSGPPGGARPRVRT